MLIHVKVKVDSKKESFVKKNETSFTISVKEPASDNLANVRILQIVAEYFGVAKGKVKIVTGHHSPSKILDVIK